MLETFQHRFTQRPIQELNPAAGRFTPGAPEERVQVNTAPYFGPCKLSQVAERRVPAQWQAEIWNARVYSPSFAITSGNTLWQTQEANTLPYEAAGYSNSFIAIDHQFAFAKAPLPAGRYPEAALIAHATSFNYFHLMLECVPKILALQEMDPEATIPAIIDARLTLTLKQIIGSLFEPHRKLIAMEEGTVISVDRLHVFSTPSYLPDDDALNPQLSCISPNSVRRTAAMLRIKDVKATDDLLWISRASYIHYYRFVHQKIRDISNNDCVEKIMHAYGAHFFSPEQYVWQSQRDRFASAKTVALVSGSAAINLLFAQPGTRVLLMCKNAGVNPGLFDLFLDALQMPHAWLFGVSKNVDAHAHFHVDENDLRRAMEWLVHGRGRPDGTIPLTHASPDDKVTAASAS